MSETSLAEDVLASTNDDWTDPSEVLALVWHRHPEMPLEEKVYLSIGVIALLLDSELLTAGDVQDEKFVPWSIPICDALRRITHSWLSLENLNPTPGEVCWLDATEEGRRIAVSVDSE